MPNQPQECTQSRLGETIVDIARRKRFLLSLGLQSPTGRGCTTRSPCWNHDARDKANKNQAPPKYIDREVKRTVVTDQGVGTSAGSEIRFEYETVTENNPAYEVWLAHDQSLVAYITSTLSEEVLGGVDDDLTALELWSTLATTGCWKVLIDAAKGCATQPPDLTRYPADFVVISFYKGDVPYRYRYDTGTGTGTRLGTAPVRVDRTGSDGSVFGSGDGSGFRQRRRQRLFVSLRFISNLSLCRFLCHLLPAVKPSTESSPAVTLSLFVSLSLVGRGLNPRRLEASVRP
ncbi:Molybdenum cofactor sulfurase [Nymphaea thermarum]|nr:Molybdenum cofactor sulfurase [Nymphaea thermarum]